MTTPSGPPAAPLTVSVRRLRDDVLLPEYHSAGAAAFDLAAAEDSEVGPGEVRLVGTGLVVSLPSGFLLAIVARSSLPIKKGLIVANGLGVVDADYCGPDDEVKVEVYNFRGAPVRIDRGERIAQGLILPAIRVAWDEAGSPPPSSRGGFGATGGYKG
jgi:dUTP pyrophosphatase